MQKNIRYLIAIAVIALLAGGVFVVFSSVNKSGQAAVLVAAAEDEECGAECELGGDEEITDVIEAEPVICTEDDCDDWSECSEKGTKTRECACDPAAASKPAQSAKCVYTPPAPICKADKWDCGAWSECSLDGKKTRKCDLAVDCESVKNEKPDTENCTPPAPKEPVVEEEKPVVKPPVKKPPVVEYKPEIKPAAKEPAAEEKPAEQAQLSEPVAEEEQTPATEPEKLPEITGKTAEAIVAELTKVDFSDVKQVEAVTAQIAQQVTETVKEDIEKKSPAQVNAAVAATVNETPAFKEAVATATVAKADTTLASPLAALGLDSTKIVAEEAQTRAVLIVEKAKLIAKLKQEGVSEKEAEKEAEKTVKKEHNKINAKRLEKALSEKGITDTKKITAGDGVADAVKVLLKADTTEKVEQKIFGADEKTSGKQTTIGISSGEKLPSAGFAAPSSAPVNAAKTNTNYNLVAINKFGQQIVLDTKTVSSNGKLVFVSTKKLPDGDYLLQVKQKSLKSAFLPWFIETAFAQDATTASPFSLVKIGETDVPQPVVKNVGNVDVNMLKNVKVKTGADGKIHVTGTADVSTMVIGTFQSAVFTSAMLADAEGGAFEVTSAQPLENGDHEVVIFAKRIGGEQTQSQPVKLAFSIVETAQAATAETVAPGRQAAPETKTPIALIGGIVGAALVLTIIVFIVKRRKKTVA